MQVALSLVLLTGSGLLLRTFVALTRMDPGYARDSVAQVSLVPRIKVVSGDVDPGVHIRTMLEQVGRLPGADAAAL